MTSLDALRWNYKASDYGSLHSLNIFKKLHQGWDISHNCGKFLDHLQVFELIMNTILTRIL